MNPIIILFSLLPFNQARTIPEIFFGRIVNGENVQPGEIPYQVSLQTIFSSFHFCGGSVLNERYVITAAHCVIDEELGTMKVVAATTDLTYPKSTHEVMKIIVHERYDSSDSWRNDIALIKVKNKFIVTSLLGFAPLPTVSQIIPADSVAVVSGWGRLWGGVTPKILQKAEISIAAQDYCRKIYGKNGYDIHDTHICAHDPVEQTGSCHGDSGGPLTVNGKLIGLVSWAMGCAMTSYPTVYTRIPKYLDWIEANTV